MAEPSSSFKLFMIISLIIALLDATFVGIAYHQARKSLIANLEIEADNLHTTFNHSLRYTIDHMLHISTFVANDPRVQQAFLQGKLAVEAEGGGKGDILSANARKALLNIVEPSWLKMTEQFQVRHLHFILRQGPVSFLRVHQPDKFGDRLDEARFAVIDAIDKQQPAGGFEIGHVYSAIRGVQPVFAVDPATHETVHVGVIETGISFHRLVHNFVRSYQTHVAVLLALEHVQATVSPDGLTERLNKTSLIKDYLIEEASSPQFTELLTSAIQIADFSTAKITCVNWNYRFYILSELPLRDYRGSINSQLGDVGKVLFWQDITTIHGAFLDNLKLNVIYAVTGFVLVEILLFFGIRHTMHRLNSEISRRTRELALSNQQLSEEITLRKNNEQRFRTLVGNIPGAVYRRACDKNWTLEYLSDAATSIIGYPPTAFFQNKARSYTSIIHPEDSAQVRSHVLTAIQQKHPYTIQYRIYDQSGSIRWVYEQGQGIFNSAGELLWLDGVIFNITERKQVEDNNQRLGEILEQSGNEIYIFSSDSLRFLQVNKGARENLGYSMNELKRMTPLDITPEFSEQSFRQLVEPLTTQAQRQMLFETIHRRKNGSSYPIEVRLQYYYDPGQPVFYAVITDITQRRQHEMEIKESQNRLKHIIEVSPATIYTLSPTGNNQQPFITTFVSESINTVSGFSPQEWYSDPKLWLKRLHSDDLKKTLDLQNQLLDQGSLDLQYRFRHKDSTYHWIHDKVIVLRNEQGVVSEIIGSWMDITDLTLAETNIRQLHQAVEQSPNLVVITDKMGNIEYVNDKITEITGYSSEEVIGKSTKIFSTGETSIETYRRLWNTITSGKEWRGILHNKKKNGEFYWSQESIAPVINDSGEITHYVAIQEDVTEARSLTEKLSYQATHDPLTGLINRREFERRLEQVIDSTQNSLAEHTLCYLDLDQFKIINDTCSHAAGDELLRQLSKHLSGLIRLRDTFARLGGDEFAVLMEHCPLERGKQAAEHILRAVEHFPFQWAERSFHIGISIGLVSITEQNKDLGELLSQADMACYMAKDAGRNRIHVYQSEDHRTARHYNEINWTSEINQAFLDNRFVLYAQPIVPLTASGQQHYEILIRLESKDGNIVSPSAFLPAAERYHLSEKIDRWIVHNTFSWFERHPQALARLSVCSINLSGQNLGDDKLLQYIIEQFANHSIPYQKICFEITETSTIQNLTAATEFIDKLKILGCKFSIDDFGSGLSSFDYLKFLPVDYLKIDGIFVKDITSDPVDLALVKSINDIGHIMGKKTIAEFVENEKIFNLLKELKVDYAQGYYVSKPVPLESIESLM